MPNFKWDITTKELRLKQTFTIARGSKKSVRNVFFQLHSEGLEGYGEAAPNSRYNEDSNRVAQYLKKLPVSFFNEIETAGQLVQGLDRWEKEVEPVHSGRAAIEMAWLDWSAKKQGQPLWKLWGASSGTGPVTSFTIGMDEPSVVRKKVKEAERYPVLKVKMGRGDDRAVIEEIRKVTDKRVRVDANEGWKTFKEARAAVDFLADYNIEMVEQPMPSACSAEMIRLKEYSPIPLCADESFEGDEDLERIARAFDMINIKLMKTGSMIKAMKIIEQAKQTGLEVMIGCMIESSLANTAGAVLSLWADHADLDGHLLIEKDPFKGLALNGETRVELSPEPGMGAYPVE